jgi:hypothetical protein
MVHDRVELSRQFLVDRGDGGVKGALQGAVENNRAGQRLFDKRLDEFLGTVRLGLFGGGDDLLEQTGLFGS